MVRKRDQTGGSDDKRGRIAVEQDDPLPPSSRRASNCARRRRRRARVAEHPPNWIDRGRSVAPVPLKVRSARVAGAGSSGSCSTLMPVCVHQLASEKDEKNDIAKHTRQLTAGKGCEREGFEKFGVHRRSISPYRSSTNQKLSRFCDLVFEIIADPSPHAMCR